MWTVPLEMTSMPTRYDLVKAAKTLSALKINAAMQDVKMMRQHLSDGRQ